MIQLPSSTRRLRIRGGRRGSAAAATAAAAVRYCCCCAVAAVAAAAAARLLPASDLRINSMIWLNPVEVVRGVVDGTTGREIRY